ncbi:MAG: DUF362 domain-containing protein [Nitrospirota bacterium]|jgi:uncharacterized protein (DUF362 family)
MSPKIPNLLFITLLGLAVYISMAVEGYLSLLNQSFSISLLILFIFSLWTAWLMSLKRLILLGLAGFYIGYITQVVGTKSGLWIYNGTHNSFVFAGLIWAISSIAMYGLSVKVLKVAFRIVSDYIKKFSGPFFVSILFLIIIITIKEYRAGLSFVFWAYYITLFAFAVYISYITDFQSILRLTIAAWIVGNLGEYLGSQSGLWTFPHNSNYPPLFLVISFWPLEFIAQYSISGLLTKEPLQLKNENGGERMHTRQERLLEKFMFLSALTYFVVGFGFILFPDFILNLINQISLKIAPQYKPVPIQIEKFWLSMTFSMMMCITALSIAAWLNIRRNINYIVPLLAAKISSALAGLLLFIFSERYFAYLAVFLVDGSLFLITLILYFRAYIAIVKEKARKIFKPSLPVKPAGKEVIVVSLYGENKLRLLDGVLRQTGFLRLLEAHFKKSKKIKEDFLIAIKPNFMFMYSKDDKSTFTDVALVEHLIKRVKEKGFKNIAIVEAQSTYGNYFKNREVRTVAKYVGYSENGYRIADLTEEMVPYDYKGRLGRHFVGKTWKDADFRISFAKNKTHTFCYYTLTLKNIYGTLPMQNKLKEYHTRREYDWPTIESMKRFPVHFGLVDAFLSADGQFGIIKDNKPNPTKTIIGGANLIAVDWVGAKKMDLDPMLGRYLPLAVEAFGMPKIKWVGDKSCYDPWENVNRLLPITLDEAEEAYLFSDWLFSGLNVMDPFFEPKRKTIIYKITRWFFRPIRQMIFKYGKI